MIMLTMMSTYLLMSSHQLLHPSLPAFLPDSLLALLSTYLPACLPPFLRTYVPSNLPAYVHT